MRCYIIHRDFIIKIKDNSLIISLNTLVFNLNNNYKAILFISKAFRLVALIIQVKSTKITSW